MGSLGDSIAAQGKNSVHTANWGTKIGQNIYRNRQFEKQKADKDEKDAIDLENDFVVNDKDLQPWAIDGIKKIQKDIYTKHKEFSSDGKGNVTNRLRDYAYKNDLFASISTLRSANLNALKSIGDEKDLGHKNKAAILSTAKTIKERNEQLAALNDLTINYDELGNFSAVPAYEYNANHLKVNPQAYAPGKPIITQIDSENESIVETRVLDGAQFHRGLRDLASSDEVQAEMYAKATPAQKALYNNDEQARLDAVAQYALEKIETINPSILYSESIRRERVPRETPEEAAAKVKARSEAKPEAGKYSWDLTVNKDGSKDFIMNNIGDATQNKEIDLVQGGFYTNKDKTIIVYAGEYSKLPQEEKDELQPAESQIIRGVPNRVHVSPDGKIEVVATIKQSDGTITETSVRGGLKSNLTKTIQQYGGLQLGEIEQKIKANGGKTLVLGGQKTGTETQVQKPLQEKSIEVKDIPKMTPSQWNTKWSSLKKGESLVGLDGTLYTKQ